MYKSKREERMKKLMKEGRLKFILKEGLVNFGLKLVGVYLLVKLIVSYGFDFSLFFSPAEVQKNFLYSVAIMFVGAYWGFMWHFTLSTEQRRKEREEAYERNKK